MQDTMVQLHPGSKARPPTEREEEGSGRGSQIRSVGVLAAHVRGKDEDRVQIPDGPLVENKWAVRPMVGLLACNQEIGVRIPGGPLHSAQPGKMPASIAAFRLYPHSTATPST